MSDTRWLEIEDDLQAAVTHFSRSLELFAVGGFEAGSLDGYRAQMALMHSMQSGHTSLEAMLVRILSLLHEDVPTGANWHADLIGRAARSLPTRPAILPAALAEAANETRRFRHVAMRNYGHFDIARVQPSLAAAAAIVDGLAPAVGRFRAVLDPA